MARASAVTRHCCDCRATSRLCDGGAAVVINAFRVVVMDNTRDSSLPLRVATVALRRADTRPGRRGRRGRDTVVRRGVCTGTACAVLVALAVIIATATAATLPPPCTSRQGSAPLPLPLPRRRSSDGTTLADGSATP